MYKSLWKCAWHNSYINKSTKDWNYFWHIDAEWRICIHDVNSVTSTSMSYFVGHYHLYPSLCASSTRRSVFSFSHSKHVSVLAFILGIIYWTCWNGPRVCEMDVLNWRYSAGCLNIRSWLSNHNWCLVVTVSFLYVGPPNVRKPEYEIHYLVDDILQIANS